MYKSPQTPLPFPFYPLMSFLPKPHQNPETLALLLPSLSTSFSSLKKAHALLVTTGASSFKPLTRDLIFFFSRLNLTHALNLHSRLPYPDPIATNYIVKALVRSGASSAALSFFAGAAHHIGCRPSRCTFPLLIAAAKFEEQNSLRHGEVLHCLAFKLGFFSHLPVPNSLIHLYASSDALDSARQLFDEMPERDVVSYNSLLDGYVQSADFALADKLFWGSPFRNAVSFSTLFNGYVRNRMFDKGIEVFRAMQEEGIEPEGCSIVSLLLVYSHFKWGLFGKSVHGYLVRKWLAVPGHVSSALVDFYGKCGLLESAARVFKRTREKDLISYSAMISGLGRRGRGEDALAVFSQMRKDGVMPNDVTFVNVLVACAHSCMIEEALRYFDMMSSEYGIKPNFAHYWCLVDLFVRIQSSRDALRVIQCMPLDNESAIWGALIWLARVRGDISVGEFLGKRLVELEPDNSRRYAPLANLYAAGSRWDKYEELQDEMKARGLKKLPDCKLIDMNVVVHKFLVGDESQPEIEEIYTVLGEIAEQLNLKSVEACEDFTRAY